MKALVVLTLVVAIGVCAGCSSPTPRATPIIRTVVVTKIVTVPGPTYTPNPTYTRYPTYTPAPPIVVTATPRPAAMLTLPPSTPTRMNLPPADGAFYYGYTNCIGTTGLLLLVTENNPDSIILTYQSKQTSFADLEQCQAYFQPKMTAALQLYACISHLPGPNDVTLKKIQNSLGIIATDVTRIRVDVFADNLCKVSPTYIPVSTARQAFQEMSKHVTYVQDLLIQYRRAHDP
jgi:hypothetical protein